MPGPGPHLMYTLATGTALTHVSNGAFTSHHCLVYAINAFLGPDIGSFCEWITHTLGVGRDLGSRFMHFVHDPVYYVLLLGGPLCFMYSRISSYLLQHGLLPTSSGVSLKAKECLCLIAAGSLSHFFLDNLFEENGHTKVLTWILSTGWWNGPAPLDILSVLVVGGLCTGLLASFVYVNRCVKPLHTQPLKALVCIGIVALLYSAWCAMRVYMVLPRQPAVGEEADLGVLVFLTMFFFLPHAFCVYSMHTVARDETPESHFV